MAPHGVSGGDRLPRDADPRPLPGGEHLSLAALPGLEPTVLQQFDGFLRSVELSQQSGRRHREVVSLRHQVRPRRQALQTYGRGCSASGQQLVLFAEQARVIRRQQPRSGVLTSCLIGVVQDVHRGHPENPVGDDRQVPVTLGSHDSLAPGGDRIEVPTAAVEPMAEQQLRPGSGPHSRAASSARMSCGREARVLVASVVLAAARAWSAAWESLVCNSIARW